MMTTDSLKIITHKQYMPCVPIKVQPVNPGHLIKTIAMIVSPMLFFKKMERY